MTLELFHATNDGGASARARQAVVDLDLVEKVQFRNVHYPEVEADLRARGGKGTPALWDGAQLLEGTDAVVAALEAHAR